MENTRKKLRAKRILATQQRAKDTGSQEVVLNKAKELLQHGGNVVVSEAGIVIARPGFTIDAFSQGACVVSMMAPAAIVDEAEIRERGGAPVLPNPNITGYAAALWEDEGIADVVGGMSDGEKKELAATYFVEGDGLDVYLSGSLDDELDDAATVIGEDGEQDDAIDYIVEGDVQIAGLFGRLKKGLKKMAKGVKRGAVRTYKASAGAGKAAYKGMVKPATSFGFNAFKKAMGNPAFQAAMMPMLGLPPIPPSALAAMMRGRSGGGGGGGGGQEQQPQMFPQPEQPNYHYNFAHPMHQEQMPMQPVYPQAQWMPPPPPQPQYGYPMWG